MSVKARRDFVDRLVRRSGCLGWICVLALITTGCATPAGVDYVDRSVACHSLTANVLYADKPSSFSARELMNLNLYQRFEEDPRQALAELHTSLAPKGDEDRVFALAELSFAYARDSANRRLT
jgi:hypothetical protein